MDKPCEDRWPTIRQPFDLSWDSIHVFRVDLDRASARYDDLYALLSEDERARATRLRFDEPRLRFVTCRGILRQILSECCGIEPKAVVLQYGAHGKPEVSWQATGSNETRIEFNVSHSRNFGLIAVAREVPVGIDIEECNSTVKILKLAERFFAPAESEELKSLPDDKQLAGFYRGWTCKEAYIKATGLGLSQSLSSFCVTIDPDKPASLRSVENQSDEPSRWTIKSLDVAPNYAAAVMVGKPGCRIECWEWPAAR